MIISDELLKMCFLTWPLKKKKNELYFSPHPELRGSDLVLNYSEL